MQKPICLFDLNKLVPTSTIALNFFVFYLLNLTHHNIFLFNNQRFSSIECIEKICGEFYSYKSVESKGIFELDQSLIESLNRYNETLLCIYKFIANRNEKVMLKFSDFDLRSQAPECLNEYIDTYIQVNEKNINNFVETNFLSRWCGWKKPNVLVSYHNIIIIAFHTDGKNQETFFRGSYEFLKADMYNNGRKSTNSCEYEFKSDISKDGMFISPTYPGTYPNLLNCSYRFIGMPGERVEIYFEEILIHYGADHCPYDVIKIYDYQKLEVKNEKNSVLNGSQMNNVKYEKVLFETYCGRKLNFTLYSTYNLFEIEFEMADSLGNEEYSEDESKILLRKGFKAFYKFSNQFADLSFVTGKHVTGSNCDQKFTSSMPNGLIYSPNFFRSHPINASCKYIFEGLNDHHNLESIKLNFYLIDVRLSTLRNICNENSVSYFVVYGSDQTKSKYCFNRLTKEPREIKSDGSHLTLVFNSINVDRFTPSNFKASYSFYTEFGIQGTRVYQNRTCLFTYNSESVMFGTINSPRYPQNYPLSIRCTYIFDISSSNQRILFSFIDFKLGQSDEKSCSKYKDNLSVYGTKEYPEYFISNDRYENYEKDFRQSWTLLNRYCGNSIPPPVITDENTKKVVLTFYSDHENYEKGFSLDYDYLILRECKYHYYANDVVKYGQIIIDRQFESNYYCDWYIKSENGKSILLSFNKDNIDDKISNQFVIRIYEMNDHSIRSNQLLSDLNSDYMIDLSEEKRQDESKTTNSFLPKFEYTLDSSTKNFILDSSFIKIQLVIGKSTRLNDGKLILNWITASKAVENKCKSNEFMCNQTKYCIDSTFYCDKIEHCPNDFSDEPDKCFVNNKIPNNFPSFVQLVTFVSSLIILVIFLTFCLFFRLKKKKKSKPDVILNSNPNPMIYYKYSPANSNSSHSIDFLGKFYSSIFF